MSPETLTCGKCGGRVPADVDHAEVEVETVHMDDRNDIDSYVLCMDCVLSLDWRDPV